MYHGMDIDGKIYNVDCNVFNLRAWRQANDDVEMGMWTRRSCHWQPPFPTQFVQTQYSSSKNGKVKEVKQSTTIVDGRANVLELLPLELVVVLTIRKGNKSNQ